MLLTKNNITVEVTHPADIRRYQSLGYVEVKSPEQLNEEAVEIVNASEGTPKASLEDMTVAELKDLAKGRGLEGYSGLNKAGLIDLLEGGEK